MVNVINAIEEALQAQKDAIFFKDLQIEDLKKQLAAAEAEIEDLRQNIAADAAQGARQPKECREGEEQC